MSYLDKIDANFSFYIRKELIKNGPYKETWMLTRLKYLSLVTLEAVLEGHKDHHI